MKQLCGLQNRENKSRILEAMDQILAVNGPLCHANKEMLERLVPYRGVQVITKARVQGFKDGIVNVEIDGRIRENYACDTVILSIGYKEDDSLYHDLELFDVPEIYLLGGF